MQDTLGRTESAARRIAIVVARFNEAVTAPLLAGARDALRARGIRDEDVEVVHVPGAFEIPFAARLVAEHGVVDGVVCLGAVIRGETPHFEYVAAVAAQGVARAAEASRVPMSFGVLTTDTVEQALARAGGAVGNKGYEAAITVLEMVALARRFRGRAAAAEG
jgi:6,7-dimethyl-8-ribityllumazine synthase